MNAHSTIRTSPLLIVIGLFVSQGVADESRYIISWADGTHTATEELQDWGTAGGNPSAIGRRLFDISSPARSILDTAEPRCRMETPYLVLPCGDCLRGQVIEYHDQDELAGVPAHFVVEPNLNFEVPNLFARPRIRVRANAVRQIITQAVTPTLDPNTLQTIAGQRESFRSLHWQANSIDILSTSGQKHFTYAELAAVKLNLLDTWDTWFHELAILSPNLESTLMKMEMADGSQLTTSRERARPVTVGGDGPEHWYHLCQPAWSLDLLAVSHRKVRMRTIFSAYETPLSAIAPAISHGEGMVLRSPTKLHINESLSGGVLRFKGSEIGCGFAVHAPYELAFDLPRSARRFRTKLALDPLVREGGCARGRIRFNGQPLYDSPLLIGTALGHDSRDLAVAAGSLTLLADPVLPDRPPNADPFDIRDDLQWLEPTLEHSRPELQRAVQRQNAAVHPGLAAWSLDSAEAGQWRLLNQLDETEATTNGFVQVIELNGPLTMTRQFKTSPAMKLRINVGCFIARGPVNVAVWVDSNRLFRQTLPERSAPSEPVLVEVPLPPSSAKSCELTIRFSPAAKTTLFELHGIAVTVLEEHPVVAK